MRDAVRGGVLMGDGAADRLASELAGWRGSIDAPQEGISFSWPALSSRLRSRVAASAPGSPFVLTAFPGGELASAASLLGVWAAGHAVAPLDLRLTSWELAKRLRLVDSDLVLTAAEHVPAVETALAAAGRRAEIRVLGPDPMSWVSWLPERAPRDRDPALVVFTSGTTGTPKGVLLSRANILAAACAVAGAQRLNGSDRVLNSLSLAHVNAPVISVLGTVVSGGDVVLVRHFEPRLFWEMAGRDVTWANLVPPLISLLSRHPNAASGRSGDRLRFVRSASAPLPVAVMKRFEDAFGIAVVESYGISEASSQVTINDVPPGRRVPGSVGTPRGVALRIVRADLGEAAPGEEGEVCVFGPSVMDGYLGDPGATAEAIRDGWLHTGDLGLLDPDGSLRLVGRINELINRGGEKIAPRIIEEAALEHAKVVDAAAVGVPDEVYGEEVKLCVVLAPGARIESGELRRFVNERLSIHARPRSVEVVGAIPRNPSGKVMRSRLA
ncbi:MAG: AMP-binding protein [Candidatus Dormibacteraceae bacterium]